MVTCKCVYWSARERWIISTLISRGESPTDKPQYEPLESELQLSCQNDHGDQPRDILCSTVSQPLYVNVENDKRMESAWSLVLIETRKCLKYFILYNYICTLFLFSLFFYCRYLWVSMQKFTELENNTSPAKGSFIYMYIYNVCMYVSMSVCMYVCM